MTWNLQFEKRIYCRQQRIQICQRILKKRTVSIIELRGLQDFIICFPGARWLFGWLVFIRLDHRSNTASINFVSLIKVKFLLLEVRLACIYLCRKRVSKFKFIQGFLLNDLYFPSRTDFQNIPI